MPVSITPLGHDLYLIDGFMHGEPERLACYLFDTPERVLIECGPSVSLESLFAALDELGIDDIATLAVTHIHLDHAGGAGHVAQTVPRARGAVHPAGAGHLTEPSRLWSSASRVWGEDHMHSLWGPMEPIPQDRLLVIDEGDRIPLGRGRSIEVMATPGHAKHHVVFVEDESGGAFVGDAVGIAFPHGHMVQPVTPPPDFDPDLVTTQLRRMTARGPGFLGFAHYGPEPEPLRALAEAETRLWHWVEWVREAARGGPGDLTEAMRAWVLDGYRAEGYAEDLIDQYDLNTFWPMQAAGILRWLDSGGV
ncbi:MAG: MBL fold metallo-hydrolase, partial [Acidimicrobiia bacterium]|nr:MBL fold metallo-hydrolase [Acidimicrobiia bacterium]